MLTELGDILAFVLFTLMMIILTVAALRRRRPDRPFFTVLWRRVYFTLLALYITIAAVCLAARWSFVLS